MDRGEYLSVVGPSGSGKSTLLDCLAGNRPATSGTVTLVGHPVTGLTPRKVRALRRRHVGFVYQKYNLVPYLTCRENLTLPAELAGRHIARQEAKAVLAEFGLDHRADVLAHHLSGGEQQRVAIARVVLTQPDVIFADEPTGALDRAWGARALSALCRLTSTGCALIVVTHDLSVAAAADRVAVLRDGVLVAPAAPRTGTELRSMIDAEPTRWAVP